MFELVVVFKLVVVLDLVVAMTGRLCARVVELDVVLDPVGQPATR